jgi:4-oxalocrotonate tautomerase
MQEPRSDEWDFPPARDKIKDHAKDRTMPHVIVRMYSGRSKQQKTRLAEEITKAVMATLNQDEAAVSVAIEDVEPKDWIEKVYKPDVLGNSGALYKKPGYNPL